MLTLYIPSLHSYCCARFFARAFECRRSHFFGSPFILYCIVSDCISIHQRALLFSIPLPFLFSAVIFSSFTCNHYNPFWSRYQLFSIRPIVPLLPLLSVSYHANTSSSLLSATTYPSPLVNIINTDEATTNKFLPQTGRALDTPSLLFNYQNKSASHRFSPPTTRLLLPFPVPHLTTTSIQEITSI